MIMRAYYSQQLEKLNENIEKMGEQIQQAIEDAMGALLKHDEELAKQTIASHAEINQMEREIENLCLNLLLSQQPMATDLRMVSAALKLVTDMQRIGDHAADISEITLLLAKQGFPENLDDVDKMATKARLMVKESVESYLKRSTSQAANVIRDDDIVDNWFVHIRKSIIAQINENIQNGEQSADILMISKYLERIADHAVNIARWVLFYVTGEHPETPV